MTETVQPDDWGNTWGRMCPCGQMMSVRTETVHTPEGAQVKRTVTHPPTSDERCQMMTETIGYEEQRMGDAISQVLRNGW